MSALLVSVRNAAEAVDAVAGGAGVIDVKEPRRGSLGRADQEVWGRVAARVDERVPLSVALGELPDYRPLPRPGDWAGICFAKWGLAGCRHQPDWRRRWLAAIESLPDSVRPVGVIYADAESAESPVASDVISQAAQVGCWGVLFDTYHKQNGTLFNLLSVAQLAPLVDSARDCGLAVALAGSLDAGQMDAALTLAPDLIAVRSAVCRGGRNGRVDREKVRRLAQIINGASATNSAGLDRSVAQNAGTGNTSPTRQRG